MRSYVSIFNNKNCLYQLIGYELLSHLCNLVIQDGRHSRYPNCAFHFSGMICTNVLSNFLLLLCTYKILDCILGVQKKGLQLPNYKEEKLHLDYYYLTVNVFHNVVICPLFFGSCKPTFFGSPCVYLYIKTEKRMTILAYFGHLYKGFPKVISTHFRS